MRLKHLLLSLPLTLALCGMAEAQPDVNNAPKGENPPNWNWNPGARGGNRGVLGGRPLQLPLTAEQLRLLREQRTEAKAQSIKQRLTGAGFTDETLQTAFVTEYKAQDTAQGDLLTKWQKINQALRVNQTPATDMTVMLKDFRDAVTKEKARRTAALTALEARFQISQNPVLDALLMTLGITGDEAQFVSQVTGNGLNQLQPLFTAGALEQGNFVNNGTATYVNPPRLFTLPNGGPAAGNGTLGNGAVPLLPLPQNGTTNGMPNAAPLANPPGLFFF